MTNEMHNFVDNQVAAAMPELPSDEILESIAALGPDLEVEIATGEAGIASIDADGKEHGFFARIKRTVQTEQRPIAKLSDALKAGGSVVFVHNVDDDNVDQVVDALADAGATMQFHFGDYTWKQAR